MDSAVSGLRFDLTAHVVQFRGSSQRKSPYGTIHLLLSVGLIIGAPGNASASWIEQSVNSPELLAVVQAVNHQVAWAVGNDARVVVTSDGGASWIPRTVPGAMNVRGLFAFDDQVAVVSDQFGSFWRTTNGGVLWTHVHGPTGMSINGIHFFDNQNGWAMGDPINGHYVILLSTNGGVSWIASPNAPPGTAFATVRSYDWVGTQIGIFSTRNWVLWRTTNAGAEWDSVGLDFQFIGGVELSNTGLGLASGGTNLNPFLRRSTDFGASWAPAPNPPQAGRLRNFDWIEGTSEVWAVTNQLGLFQSTNDGVDWLVHTLAPPDEFIAEDIDFLDQDNAWCVGWHPSSGARIFRWTTTAGVAPLPVASAPLHVTALPNPFRFHVTLEATEGRGPLAECAVYDVSGRSIWTLHPTQGSSTFRWNGLDHAGRPVPSGTYFYRVRSGHDVITGRIVKLP